MSVLTKRQSYAKYVENAVYKIRQRSE